MAAKEPVTVLVTGAAGQIGYGLARKIARGVILGPDQPVILHLLDIQPAVEALNGVKMELLDVAFPLLKGVVATTDVVKACTGVNIAMVDVGFSRKKGTEAKDFMPFYNSLALELGLHAAADLEILAVGHPENAKDLFSASSIPMKNVTCLTTHHYLAQRLNVPAGNHPSTPYPNTSFATFKTPNGEKSVPEFDADDARIVGGFIIKASERSRAMSAASSAWDHSREETLVSMGEDSDGSHSVPAGRNGTCSIVEGTPTPAIFQSEVEGKIKETEERLEMISYRLKELEDHAAATLRHYSAALYEFNRHTDNAFVEHCNKIEFLERQIANLESNLANAHVYLHRAFQEVAYWRQLYWNLRSRVIPSRVSVPVPHA